MRIAVHLFFYPEHPALLLKHNGNVDIQSISILRQVSFVFIFNRTPGKTFVSIYIDPVSYKFFIHIGYRNHVTFLIYKRSHRAVFPSYHQRWTAFLLSYPVVVRSESRSYMNYTGSFFGCDKITCQDFKRPIIRFDPVNELFIINPFESAPGKLFKDPERDLFIPWLVFRKMYSHIFSREH